MIKITVAGQAPIQNKLNKLIGGLNEEFIADEAAAIVFRRIRTRFLKQTSPDGERWQDSNAALQRALSGRGGGTLYDTGRLYKSIQLASEGRGLRSIGTDVEYAPKLQPTWPFMGIADEDVTIVYRRLQAHIKKLIT